MLNYKDVSQYNSIFSNFISEYITMRENMGIKIKVDGNVLRQFDKYCVYKKVKKLEITSKLIESWLQIKSGENRNTHAKRISVLNNFCRFLRQSNIPISWIAPYGYASHLTRYVPYIFTEKEIHTMFKVADENAKNPNISTNFHVMFPYMLRILYGCGLRIEEALSLKTNNVNLGEKYIYIEEAKFSKSRKLPLSESLVKSLINYSKKYKYLINDSNIGYFFPNRHGIKYSSRTFYDNFRFLLKKSNIKFLGKGKGPRVHDLRHTFAVHSLRKQIENGVDVYVSLNVLMTYLGHSKISSTEYYLRLTSEVFPDILKASNKMTNSIIPEVKQYEEK